MVEWWSGQQRPLSWASTNTVYPFLLFGKRTLIGPYKEVSFGRFADISWKPGLQLNVELLGVRRLSRCESLGVWSDAQPR